MCSGRVRTAALSPGARVDEREAIERLRGGDIGGLEPLVRAYYLAAVRTAALILHDRDLAEDIAQAAFVRAYERIGQFDPARPFGPWFLRSVANAARQAARDGRRRAPPTADRDADADPAALLIDPDPGPEALLEQAETVAEVRALLRRLTPAQRAAIVQRYLLDQNEADVARALALPVGTVKWRLHVARQRLRALLQGDPTRRDRSVPEREGKP